MSNFNKTMVKIFKHEGGFVNDKSDSGGATNMGITKRTLEKWRGEKLTVKDVRELTKKEAKEIYQDKYWDVMRLDAVDSDQVASAIMDFGVNAGPRTAIKTLQKALNDYGESLVVDGLIGNKTIRAINTITDSEDENTERFEYIFLLLFFKLRIKYYTNLAKRRPKDRKFLYFWNHRSLDYV